MCLPASKPNPHSMQGKLVIYHKSIYEPGLPGEYNVHRFLARFGNTGSKSQPIARAHGHNAKLNACICQGIYHLVLEPSPPQTMTSVTLSVIILCRTVSYFAAMSVSEFRRNACRSVRQGNHFAESICPGAGNRVDKINDLSCHAGAKF